MGIDYDQVVQTLVGGEELLSAGPVVEAVLASAAVPGVATTTPVG